MSIFQQYPLSRMILALSVVTSAMACPMLLPSNAFAQANIEVIGRRQSVPPVMPTIMVDDAINIIGFDVVKPGSKGRLEIGQDGLRLVTGKGSSTIPGKAISFFAIDNSTKALLRGAPGLLASLAPNGAGQLYGAIRTGAATLTFFYRDENDALHGAVILLPKSSKEDLIRAFAHMNLEPGDATTLEEALADRDTGQMVTDMGPRQSPRSQRAGVAIALPRANGLLPPAFTAATYEALVAQVNKARLFNDVWRQGDNRFTPDTLRLDLDVTEYKKGNAGVRGAIPVVGMIAGKTLIQADLRLFAGSGELLFEEEVKGSKRMMGESIAASTSLAQRASKALAKAPGLSDAGRANREVAAR